MTDATFDPVRVAAALRACSVRYVIVGDLAEMAHGSPVVADRVEVCVPDADEQVARLGTFLDAIGAQQDAPGDDPHRVSFRTSAGPVECIEMPGPAFDGLEARSSEVDLGNGVAARVAPPTALTEQRLGSDDLVGAVRTAWLDAEAEEVPAFLVEDGDEFGPEPIPEGFSPFRRIWRAFEDVDRYLTEVTEGTRSRSRVGRR